MNEKIGECVELWFMVIVLAAFFIMGLIGIFRHKQSIQQQRAFYDKYKKWHFLKFFMDWIEKPWYIYYYIIMAAIFTIVSVIAALIMVAEAVDCTFHRVTP